MSVFRIEQHTDNYTIMSNCHLMDKRLSLGAIGLLSKMLSLPDDWDYTFKGLVSICKEKGGTVKAALKELKQAGYLEIVRQREDNGQISYEYNVYEQPKEPLVVLPSTVKPSTVAPTTASPLTVKQPQLNTNILNTNILNTNISSTNKQSTDKRKENIKKKRWKKPTIEEIKQYCIERNNNIDAEYFFDYYERCGWMVGRDKHMTDWKATIRTWERNDKKWSQEKKDPWDKVMEEAKAFDEARDNGVVESNVFELLSESQSG